MKETNRLEFSKVSIKPYLYESRNCCPNLGFVATKEHAQLSSGFTKVAHMLRIVVQTGTDLAVL